MHRLTALFVISTLSLIAFVLTLGATQAQAQTFTVLHNFTGGADGALPMAGITMDAAGNLYGTTSYGGAGGTDLGTVFRLKHSGPNWILTTLHTFVGGADGAYPYGRVAIARDGTLYGTTTEGGSGGSGTIYRLQPSAAVPRSALAPWNETVLHRFTGSDGASPQGDLIFDRSGNIYGTTQQGGSAGGGVIYELAFSAGNWTETVLYSDQGYRTPSGGVVFDGSGNLYGVFEDGGSHGDGAVYELSPAGSGWTEQILYGPGGEEWNPLGGLIMDPSGNLYGTVPGFGGGVFELTHTNGWIFNELYDFGGSGEGPMDKLVMDSAGNLYGTTCQDGDFGSGGVFELVLSNGTWNERWLHSFTGGNDGNCPMSNLVFDANGNLYGTTSFGGTYGSGVVFEITP